MTTFSDVMEKVKERQRLYDLFNVDEKKLVDDYNHKLIETYRSDGDLESLGENPIFEIMKKYQ